MTRRMCLGLALAYLLNASSATNKNLQQDKPRQPRPVFRTSVDLRLLRVDVLDDQDQPVLGLSPEEFRITDSGVARSIQTFIAPEFSRFEVAVLMDHSQSMQPNRMLGRRDAREMALKFLDRLKPTDCVLLVPFTHTVEQATWQAADSGELRATIRRLNFEGGTALFAAILKAQIALAASATPHFGSDSIPAADLFTRGASEAFLLDGFHAGLLAALTMPSEAQAARGCGASPNLPANQAIVVVTDGRDTVTRETGQAQILLATASSRVPIYAASVSMFGDRPPIPGEGVPEVVRAIGPVAKASGGEIFRSTTFDRSYNWIRDRVDRARSHYLIGYAADPVAYESRARRLDGDVTDSRFLDRVDVETINPDHEVRVHAGYGPSYTSSTLTAAAAAVRGFVSRHNGNHERAIAEFRQTIVLDPSLAAGHYGLGLSLLDSGAMLSDGTERNEATRSLDTAIRLAPWISGARAALAKVAEADGDLSSARRWARAAVQGNPEHGPLVGHFLKEAPSEARPSRPAMLVYLLPPSVPDVAAQIDVVEVLAALGRRIVAADGLGLASSLGQATHAIRIHVDSLEGGPPMRMHATLSLHARSGQEARTTRLEIDDREVDATIDVAVASAVDWLLEAVGSSSVVR